MGLLKNKDFAYLNVREGKIVLKAKDRADEEYDSVEGYLTAIDTTERTIKGSIVRFWIFDLVDNEGDRYRLSLNYRSGVVKALLNNLASIEGEIGLLKISTYQRSGFTKITVSNNGERLSWKYETLPPVETTEVAGQTIKDDSKRMLFFEQIAEEINNKLQ